MLQKLPNYLTYVLATIHLLSLFFIFSSKVYASWFTVVDGDVFIGSIDSSDYPAIPSGGYSGYIVEDSTITGTGLPQGGYVFSQGDLDAVSGSSDRLTENTVSVDSKKEQCYAKDIYLSEDALWPPTETNYSIPSSAQSLTDLKEMRIRGNQGQYKVYKVNADLITDSESYQFNPIVDEDGVIVLYIQNTKALDFTKNFVSSESTKQRRVMIVADMDIIIKDTVGGATPDKTPNLQAGFLVQSDGSSHIEFENGATAPVVDGLLIAKSILLDRDLADNTYPATVVKYDPIYLYWLSKQERSSNNRILNYSGLFRTDVTWSTY